MINKKYIDLGLYGKGFVLRAFRRNGRVFLDMSNGLICKCKEGKSGSLTVTRVLKGGIDYI